MNAVVLVGGIFMVVMVVYEIVEQFITRSR